MTKRERAEIDKILASSGSEYGHYANDPARFGYEELGEIFTDDIVKVMESVRDNPITVAKSANGTGKTHAAARIATWFFKAFEDSQVYTAAAPPENNLKNLLWGEIGSITEDRPALFDGYSVGALHISRNRRSFITGVTIPSTGTPTQREARFSGKHAPHMLFIVDEGDAVPEEVYKGIESCMSGGHARLLVLFNPRHEAGPLYRMERDRQAHIVQLTAFDHPNVKTGEDQIPGAVDREKTVRRINEWSRPLTRDENPDGECFEVPEFLVGCIAKSLDGNSEYPPLTAGWRKITNSAFSYMVLAEYPSQASNQLVSSEWVNNARARWDAYVAQHGENPPAMTKPIMGIDIAEMGDDSNVACFRYGGWVAQMRTWDGLDVDATADRAAQLYKSYNAEKASVDGTGVGAGVAPKMTRLRCRANGVKVASSPTYATEMGEFFQLRDQLYWSMREWLRTDTGAMLPPDEMLIEELLTPTYEVKGNSVRVMKKDDMKDLIRRSPDRMDALAMTFAPAGKVARAG